MTRRTNIRVGKELNGFDETGFRCIDGAPPSTRIQSCSCAHALQDALIDQTTVLVALHRQSSFGIHPTFQKIVALAVQKSACLARWSRKGMGAQSGRGPQQLGARRRQICGQRADAFAGARVAPLLIGACYAKLECKIVDRVASTNSISL